MKKSSWKRASTKQLLNAYDKLSDKENAELEEYIASRFVGKPLTFIPFRSDGRVLGLVLRYTRVVKDNKGYLKIKVKNKTSYKQCKTIFNGQQGQ